ncbi:synaptotagmin-like protein 5 [Hetaerina americana]|uniref:synaptotagmin-like protein 5 n=1 Tax=Hetaerina americana TaxID=62018 RepID=UPI003A7F59B9
MATVTVRSSREEECRRLKAELQFLRRKGALRADWDPNSGPQTTGGGSPGGTLVGVGLVGGLGSGLIGGGGGSGGGGGGNGGGRACARCRAELGRIINRGAFCRACRLRVCKACREYNVRATDWVCSVCHKHMEIQVATGEWMNEFVRRPSRRRDNRVYVPAADIVKRSIRRSWTISTSHRRSFGGPQGSPELRAYSSLPRGASYLPAAAAEAAADAADAAAADNARRSTDNRESPPHRRLPAHPLLYLLRRGSSSGSGTIGVGGSGDRPMDAVPTRRCVSQDEDVMPPLQPPIFRRDEDAIFSSSPEKKHLSGEEPASPVGGGGRRLLGRKGISLRRQQAVSTGSAGSTGEGSSEGESFAPKSPRERKGSGGERFARVLEKGGGGRSEEGGVQRVGRGESLERKAPKEKEAAAGKEGRQPPRQQQKKQQEEEEEDEEEEDPVEDFDVEPLSGTIFRKVTIKRKKKKKSVEEEVAVVDGDDTVSGADATGKGSSAAVGTTTPTAGSAPPTPGGAKKVSTGSSIGSWATSPPLSPSAGANNTADDEPTNERIPNTHQQSTTLSSLGGNHMRPIGFRPQRNQSWCGCHPRPVHYMLRSDSMASVYSGAGEGRYGTVAVRGEVEFALQYNYKQGALEILVKQCRELAPVDTKRNRSDPYVKVYLLPDKSKSGKRKTKVKKHTLNPVFDETLKFHITLNGLETRTLWLTVWHSDMFGRNDFLGEVMMSLENKVFDDPSPKWYPLQERTEPFDDLLCYKGEMIVGLKFVPPDVTNLHKKGRMSKGSLHVLVKDAKNLTAVKANGTSDPFCKSYLLPDKGRSSKQKTAVCRRSINPVWNHTFVYDDVSLQELSERSLELTVWDHDRLASNEFLGGLRFNLGSGKHYGKNVDWMDATGREMTLWQSMLERANFWVEGCLTLRPTLDHRSSPSSTLAS